ncbi:hypothetical protein Y032_0411g968 [Ancylostoma ceylanicum]|nr:hypothetical protein Y032_0411g968 [Ancylostoma ceylanicum]
MIESYLGSEQSMIGPIIEGSEEAAAQYLEISAQPPLKSTKHRHSVHTSNVHQLQINSAQFDKANRSNGQFLKHPSGPQRSTSSDCCREERKEPLPNGNKFLKWLGLGGGTDKKDLKHRRMSTFT